MKTLTEQLTQYATYHRDPRNITTHFFGVPMIVVGVSALLARPAVHLGVSLSPALVVTALAMLFYFLLDLRYGIAMALFMGGALAAGNWIAAQSTFAWLATSLGLFGVGWVIQFVGHIYEGRKPAFVDDLVGLLVGPLFVVAEWGFALGLRKEVREAVEAKAGPVVRRGERGAAVTR